MSADLHAEELTRWLFSLEGPSNKWDLDTARSFCAWLGHPERAFPALHVAGTNGKGSVAATVHAIALAAGWNAGLNTSPHLVRPEERIRVGADDVAPQRFHALIARLRDEAAAALAAGALPRHPSFFEMITAAAFLAFREANVPLAVIETGLGGRLDATNVIEPRVSVITTIGLDHVKTLGGSLAAIAREKAGIVKPGVPVLAGWIPARALAEIRAAAVDRGAPLHLAADELVLRARRDGTFDLTTPEAAYERLAPALVGAHQRRNVALAVRAVELLRARGLALPHAAVAAGVANVRWPGRMERIGRVLLDGAHNAEGARALGRALDAAAGPFVLVFGVTEGRDPAQLVAPLAPHVARLVVTRPAIPKAVDPAVVHARLAAAFPALAPELEPDTAAALARAHALAGDAGAILVAGSLYLVGDVRRALLGLDGPGHPERETRLAAAVPEPRKGTVR